MILVWIGILKESKLQRGNCPLSLSIKVEGFTEESRIPGNAGAVPGWGHGAYDGGDLERLKRGGRIACERRFRDGQFNEIARAFMRLVKEKGRVIELLDLGPGDRRGGSD